MHTWTLICLGACGVMLWSSDATIVILIIIFTVQSIREVIDEQTWLSVSGVGDIRETTPLTNHVNIS